LGGGGYYPIAAHKSIKNVPNTDKFITGGAGGNGIRSHIYAAVKFLCILCVKEIWATAKWSKILPVAWIAGLVEWLSEILGGLDKD